MNVINKIFRNIKTRYSEEKKNRRLAVISNDKENNHYHMTF